MSVTFRTVLELHGKTATGLRVPPEVVEALGAGKKPPVVVTLPGHVYRSTVAPRDGGFLLPLSAEHRAASGLSAGDEVEVTLELDLAPRTVHVPEDLAAALAGAPRQAFDALSYSRQLAHVLSVDGARTPETRERRVAKVLTDLGGTTLGT
ncbi:MAG: hypothetical protein JWM64_2439 [Frankiales bacterium]|nr:hypothetical protein [Frankiales bacterium]